MEVLQVLHMNKGVGEASYAKNSTLQNKIISTVKPTTKEAITKTLCYTIPESMGIADLGCSSGPNALVVISEIIDVVHGLCHLLDRPMPELRVHLNDLPSNDFNNIFGSLPEFYNRLKQEKGSELGPCFVSAVPGSFYGRLFPSKSLHFVHSSSSLHWLSQVPTALDCNAKQALNKGKIYISKTSPISVMEAYAEQFQKDFSVFLKSRSEEIVSGGQMVLSFMGRRSLDPTTEESCYHWELLAQALMSMVSEGRVDEEKLDSFNAPYYAPCPEEIETEVQKDGSFIIDSLEAFEIDWDADNNEIIYGGENNAQYQRLTSGQRVAKTIRAVVESMLECQFGGDIMDDLFHRHSQIVGDHLSKRRTKYINLVVSLIKQG